MTDINAGLVQHEEIIVLTSAARTAAVQSSDIYTGKGKGLIATLNVTAASGTGGLTLRFQGKDPVSGTYYYLNAAPTAVTATGLKVYLICRDGGTVAGDVLQATTQPLPRVVRVAITVGDTSSYTYSVGLNHLV